MVKAVIELHFEDVADAFNAVENAKDFYNDEKQSWLFEKAVLFLAYIEDAEEDADEGSGTSEPADGGIQEPEKSG